MAALILLSLASPLLAVGRAGRERAHLRLPATAIIGAAARTFPDTQAKILVFDDQLPSSMTEAQWRFAATHYAGCQGTRLNLVSQFLQRYLQIHHMLEAALRRLAQTAGNDPLKLGCGALDALRQRLRIQMQNSRQD